jgi:general secretion pathway protein D
VPFLGDIPLMGRLFKSTRTQRVKRNLMVFIKPRILDESHSSAEEYQKLKELREMQGKSLPATSFFESAPPSAREVIKTSSGS